MIFFFEPSVKERYSIISSDSRDSFLNDKFELSDVTAPDSAASTVPPELPEKQSPVKSATGQRDSGYNEVSGTETVMIGTPEQIVDKVLSERVKGDVVDAFLSSYRTFMTLEKVSVLFTLSTQLGGLYRGQIIEGASSRAIAFAHWFSMSTL